MKICSERAEALDRNNAPGADVLAAEQGLEALADGVVARTGKESQEAALSLEQAADGFPRARVIYFDIEGDITYGAETVAGERLRGIHARGCRRCNDAGDAPDWKARASC